MDVFNLMKCVLAHWCADVISLANVLQISSISDADISICGVRKLSFGMLGASTSAPWGTIERSRFTWGHKKGDLKVTAWISIDFGLVFGQRFDSCSVILMQIRFLSSLVSGSLFQWFRGRNPSFC